MHQGQEVRPIDMQVELGFGGQAGALEPAPPGEQAHRDDRLHRSHSVPVLLRFQESAQHALIRC